MNRLLAVALSIFLAQATPSGSVGIRLVDAPTNRADDPRARLYIVDHLAPGTTIHRRVEVSNGASDRMTISLYPAAADVQNGEFRFGDGHAANDLTSWTTVDPNSVTVDPGRAAVATVTIAVPSTATGGERYGVVWAELPAARPAGGASGVAAVNRVGIRMYLSVGTGGEPPTDFSISSVRGARAADGSPEVLATVKNTGGRALDLSGDVQLSNGPGGLGVAPVKAQPIGTLGIGQTETAAVKLDRAVPAGPWTAHLTLRSGRVEHSVDARVTFAGGSASRSSGGGGETLTLAIAGVGVAAVAGLGAVVLLRRRRRSTSAA